MLFVRRQQTLANPLLDLRLFSNRAFSASVAINTLGVFVVFGGFLYIAQYLQLVLGLSPLLAGLWSLPGAVAVIITSNLAPIIVRRTRPAYVIGVGLVLTAVGYGLLTQINAASALAGIVIANFIMSAGFGLVFILTSDMVIGAAPAERAGAASAISETGAEFGGALGIAVLGTIGTAVYRTLMADSMPTNVPHAMAEIARDTLGGAVTVASQLPDQLGLTLLTASREAFTQGMHLTAWIATILMMSIAILTVTLLRNVQPGGHEEQTAHEYDDECDDEYFGNGCLEPVLVPIAVQDRR
jgi:DHA2 family multidrug resistance protein-like MFS transporter